MSIHTHSLLYPSLSFSFDVDNVYPFLSKTKPRHRIDEKLKYL